MIIGAFLDTLEYEKKYSQHTLKAYRKDLAQFQEFLVAEHPPEGLPDEAISFRDIRLWIVSLMNEGLSSRSVNRKLSSLKSYFKYLSVNQVIPENPAKYINGPRVGKSLPSFVAVDKINYLIDKKTEEGYPNQRSRMIIEILYGTGMRVSELTGLKDTDISLQAKTMRVTGKRSKQRLIPFPREMAYSIKEYLSCKYEFSGSPYFILTNKGGQAYPKMVYNTVRQQLSLVTTQKYRGPHALRHSYATHMLNSGANLNAIKELLGHTNLSATQVYTHTSLGQLLNVYKQAHPRAYKRR